MRRAGCASRPSGLSLSLAACADAWRMAYGGVWRPWPQSASFDVAALHCEHVSDALTLTRKAVDAYAGWINAPSLPTVIPESSTAADVAAAIDGLLQKASTDLDSIRSVAFFYLAPGSSEADDTRGCLGNPDNVCMRVEASDNH